MPKFTSSAPRARRFPVVPAAIALSLAVSMVGLAGCGESTAPWPSTGPVDTLTIHTIPSGAARVVLRGESLRMLGVPQDATGRWVDVPVTWSTSNAQIATIDQDGVLTAIGNVNPSEVDTITVTATAAGKTATEQVIIRRFPAVATVGMSPTRLPRFLPLGSEVQITATARDAAGTALVGRSVEWRTSNSAIVTVSQTGLATLVAPGNATISAVAVEEGEEIIGTTDVIVATPIGAGSFVAEPIPDNRVGDYTYVVPAGVTSFRVNISGPSWLTGGTGDADLYVFGPGVNPTGIPGAPFVCRPFAFGSVEQCTIANVTAGARYGIGIHAFLDDGLVEDLTVTITENP